MQQSTKAMATQLQTLLSEATAQQLCFQQLLNEESQALETNNYNELVNLTTAKQSRLNHIARYSDQVVKLLKSLTPALDSLEIHAALSQFSQALADQWQGYSELLLVCREQNRKNHSLLATRKHFVEETLRFLDSQAKLFLDDSVDYTATTTLYNSLGQRDYHQTRQKLATI